jgi:uncharacterized protein (TIGR02145 family)
MIAVIQFGNISILTLLLNLVNVNKLINICSFILFITVLSSCEKGSSPPIYIDGSSVVDAEGNLYKTVIIGDQEWMAENLRTNLFCSGDSIPYSGDIIQVKVYNNDPQNETIFGKLYNYQAVLNLSGLCPCGWHVPTELDYAKLIDYLGGYYAAMTKMKSRGFLEDGTGLWSEREPISNYPGTNSSGFNALPSGYGYYDTFLYKDTLAAFWAVPETSTNALKYQIYNPYIEKQFYSNPQAKEVLYYSVRCVKTFP